MTHQRTSWAKAHARRLGMSLDAYRARLASGERWCGACKAWEPKAAFGRDASRPDGLAPRCLVSEAARRRAPRPPRASGPTANERHDVLETVYALARAHRPHREIIDVIREEFGR